MTHVLTRVDELIRRDCRYLSEHSECYFLREYTSGQGYEFGETNQLIYNLKKSPDRHDRPEWIYKLRAIEKFSTELAEALNPSWLRSAILVPMPPSRSRSDPLHDDRMLQVLGLLNQHGRYRVIELIEQTRTTEPAHAAQRRPGPDEILSAYRIRSAESVPQQPRFAVFDDVLTTGAHFAAAEMLLRERFPDCDVVGIFWARAIRLPLE